MNNNDFASLVEWHARGIELEVKHLSEYPDRIELIKRLIMMDVEKLKEYADMMKTE